MNASIHNRASRRQQGAVTLAIGIVLLLLITLVTLYGGRIQVLEQRISANEYRAKEAFGAAEAGLNMGLEYLKANRNLIRSTSTGIDLSCAADDGWLSADCPRNRGIWTQVNCDAPSGQAETDACLGVADSLARKDDQIGTVLFYNDLSSEDVPNTTSLSNGATYTVDYALCARGSDWAAPCSPNIVDAEDIAVVITSTGQSTDLSAEATVQQLIGTFGIIPGNAIPPLMAAGTVNASGNFSVVVNANGGGEGVPISAWASDDLDMTGAGTMCHADEYFASGTEQTYSDQTPETGFQICDDCTCPQSESLTHTLNSIYYEGIDIVDVDGDTGPTPDATNFPTDVFQYIFGVPHANYEEIKERAVQVDDCGALDENSAGLYWLTVACTINQTVGHPEHPVLLVTESSINLDGNAQVFGLAYAFSYPPDGILGGDITMRGSQNFYGAIVADHEIQMGNGAFRLVYSDELLGRLQTEDDFKTFGRVPGTWADHAN